jgi:hypothetical protein
MKLFELKTKLSSWDVEYFTAKAPALRKYNKAVQEMKKLLEGTPVINRMYSVTLYEIEVHNNLLATDWCELLRSDGPGLYCEKTPQDFISVRREIKHHRQPKRV